MNYITKNKVMKQLLHSSNQDTLEQPYYIDYVYAAKGRVNNLKIPMLKNGLS